jgi:hypothetical protein
VGETPLNEERQIGMRGKKRNLRETYSVTRSAFHKIWLFLLLAPRHTSSLLSKFICLVSTWLGDSANAVPHIQKLRTRLTHILGNRRVQPHLSAMAGSLPEGTAFMITDSSVPSKYVVRSANIILERQA